MKKIFSDNEIWVFINDNDGKGVWGEGYIYAVPDDESNLPYRALMYQSRIDVSNASFDEADELLSEGKLYTADCKDCVESLNSILDFWFESPVKELPEVYQFSSKDEIEAFLKQPFSGRYFLAQIL